MDAISTKDLKVSALLLTSLLGIVLVFIVYKIASAAAGEGTPKPGKSKPSETGGYVQYSKDYVDYDMMEEPEKMNYAYYMMRYNVHDRKEIAEGALEVKSIKRPEDLFKIQSPKAAIYRFSNVLAYLGFMLFIIVFLAWIIAIIKGANPVKKDALRMGFLLLLGILALSYILEWVQHRTETKLDAISSSL